MKKTSKSVPAAALHFRAGVVDFTKHANAAIGSSNISMIARSGQPIDHWSWGMVGHDLEGVKVKDKIPIDYSHDTGEIIGYLDSFEVTGDGLRAGGKLVSFTETDRAAEVAYKSREGIPYEASINFGGDGIEVEQVDEGETTEVNGYTLTGPAAVIRSWPLRGVAVTPYGADANTESEIFNSGGDVAVDFINRNEVTTMASEQSTADVAVDDQVENSIKETDADQVDEETAEAVDDTAIDETDEAAEAEPTAEADADAEAVDNESSEPAEAAALSLADGQRYLERFGEAGAVWFVEGKTFGECIDLHIEGLESELEHLRDEKGELRQRVAAVDRGEDDPLGFSAAPSSADAETKARIDELEKQHGSKSEAAFANRFASRDN